MITFGFRNRMSGIFRAAAAIILGAVMVAMPDSSLEVLVQILAAMLIASGLVSVAYGIANRASGGLGLMIFNSVVDILLGILIFCFPAFVASFIIIVLGIALLALGLMQIFVLVSAGSFVRMGFLAFVFPALSVLGGLLLVFEPFGIASAVTLVAGIALFIYGVSELIASWKMRKAMKEYEIRFSPDAGRKPDVREPDIEVRDVEYEKVDDTEGDSRQDN